MSCSPRKTSLSQLHRNLELIWSPSSLDVVSTIVPISQQPATTLGTSLKSGATSSLLTRSLGASSSMSSGSTRPLSGGYFTKLQIAVVIILAVVVATVLMVAAFWCTRKLRNGLGVNSSNGTSTLHGRELLDYPSGLRYNSSQESEFGHDYQGGAIRSTTQRMVPRDEPSGHLAGSSRPSQRTAVEAEHLDGMLHSPTPPLPARSPLRLIPTQPPCTARPATMSDSVLHFMGQRTVNIVDTVVDQSVGNVPKDYSLTFPPPTLRKKGSSVYST